MVQPDLPENNNDELDGWLEAALDRITAAEDDGINAQVNREILRYWHERVKQAGHNADEIRRIRAEISQLILDVR